MITLNLLSPDKKKELENKINFILIQKSLLFIVIFLAITSLLFYGTKIYQDNKLNNLKKEFEQIKLTLPSGEKVTLSKDIQDINNELSYLNNIQMNYLKCSDLLIDFNALVPTGIALNSLSVNQKTLEVLINGKAVLRENLVAFQNNLENSSFLKDIESPISNILKREDIDFSFKAKLNLEKK
jgi:Tfp pilus assembly protein PilN